MLTDHSFFPYIRSHINCCRYAFHSYFLTGFTHSSVLFILSASLSGSLKLLLHIKQPDAIETLNFILHHLYFLFGKAFVFP